MSKESETLICFSSQGLSWYKSMYINDTMSKTIKQIKPLEWAKSQKSSFPLEITVLQEVFKSLIFPKVCFSGVPQKTVTLKSTLQTTVNQS